MTTVVVAIALALVFDVSNGFHDSSNSVAALVATRAARPASAVVLAGAFHLLGPLLAGEAVALRVTVAAPLWEPAVDLSRETDPWLARVEAFLSGVSA